MNARDLESAAANVDRKRRRALHGLITAVALMAASAGIAPFSARLALAVGVGAAMGWLIAAVSWLGRRELISCLALDPSAYAIPAVARFGTQAAALSTRTRLASSIHSLVHQKDQPMELHLAGRARRFAPELDAIARDLAAPSSHVPPPIAVACRRLVTRPVRSPLYNPNLPEEDLTALLLRIRAGITPGDAGASAVPHAEAGGSSR